MTAKQYLLQYKLITARIQNMEEDLAELREARSSITINLDGMPHGTDLSDKTAALAAKLADMETDIIDLRSEAWSKRMEISNTIGMLHDPLHVRILFLRYIEDRKWEEIADTLHYTVRWITSKHGNALTALQYVLDVLDNSK